MDEESLVARSRVGELARALIWLNWAGASFSSWYDRLCRMQTQFSTDWQGERGSVKDWKEWEILTICRDSAGLEGMQGNQHGLVNMNRLLVSLTFSLLWKQMLNQCPCKLYKWICLVSQTFSHFWLPVPKLSDNSGTVKPAIGCVLVYIIKIQFKSHSF